MDSKRWIPAPRRLLARAMRKRWNRETPADDVVGYLHVWALLQDGEQVPRRDVAEDLGWTEHKARKMIDQVRAEFTEWQALTATNRPKTPKSRPKPAQNRPSKANVSDYLDSETAQKSPTVAQKSPLTRAGSTVQKQDSTKGSNDPDIDHALESDSSTPLAFPTGSESVPPPPANAGPKRQKGGASKSERVDLRAIWQKLEDIRLENTVGGLRNELGKRRDTLRARVNEHGADAVVNAWLWWHTSDHHRARFLRAKYRYSTFFRASNLREYVELANEWQNEAPPVDIFDRSNFDENGNLISSEGN